METKSYMDYKDPLASGQRAFLMGLSLGDNPVNRRTGANHWQLWNQGWERQSKIKCKGIALDYYQNKHSGCTQTGGDCPVCGK